MAGLNRIPSSMIRARGKVGGLVSNAGTSLEVLTDDTSSPYLVKGGLDITTGVLTLTLSDSSTITIDGFFTANTVVQGQQGLQGLAGKDGRDGIDGTDGEKGATGCQGAVGPRGPTGDTGPRGERGLQGATGPTGPKGERGDDGYVQLFIQSADYDPASVEGTYVKAGAIWVIP